MKSRILILILMSAILSAVTACSVVNAPGVPPTLAVAPTRTSAPPVVITATTAPTTVPTTAPVATNTAPPTNTAGPTSASSTNTVPATATSTRPPATATRPPTATAIPIKYIAPVLLEPLSNASFTVGNAFVFKWEPVGDLGQNECYQIQVTIINPVDNTAPGNRYVPAQLCDWNQSQGNPQFALKYKPPSENYLGLLSQAVAFTNANTLKVDWSVMVVLDQGSGKYAPLSPASQTVEFLLQNP